jgi:SET domain-containing protein
MPTPKKTTRPNAGRRPASLVPRKKNILPPPADICVRLTPDRGRGVFALRDFAAGELIEAAPVIHLPGPQYKLLNKTGLKDYYFKWEKGRLAVALGFGSIYNHSEAPNAEFLCHPPTMTIRFTTSKPIPAGEEILVDYDCELWFDVR